MKRLNRFALTLAVLMCAITEVHAQTPATMDHPACRLQDSDKAWLDRAVIAWRQAALKFGQFIVPADARAVIGSADCVLISETALLPSAPVLWTAVSGNGQIPVAEKVVMPLSPVSQAMEVEGKVYFVMPRRAYGGRSTFRVERSDLKIS